MFFSLLPLVFSAPAIAQDADDMTLILTCPDEDRCPNLVDGHDRPLVAPGRYFVNPDNYTDEPFIVKVDGDPWVVMHQEGRVVVEAYRGYELHGRLESSDTDVFRQPMQLVDPSAPDVVVGNVLTVELATCYFDDAKPTEPGNPEWDWTINPQCSLKVPDLMQYDSDQVVVQLEYSNDYSGDANMDTNVQDQQAAARAEYMEDYLKSLGLTAVTYAEPMSGQGGVKKSVAKVQLVVAPTPPPPPPPPVWECPVSDAFDEDGSGEIERDECKSPPQPKFNPLNHLRLGAHVFFAAGYTGHNEQVGVDLIIRVNDNHSVRFGAGGGTTPVPGWAVEDGDYDPSTWQGTGIMHNDGDFLTIGYANHYFVDYWFTKPSGRLLNPMWAVGYSSIGLRKEAGDGRMDQISDQFKAGPMWTGEKKKWILGLDGYLGFARGEIDPIRGPSTESVGDLTTGPYGVLDYGGRLWLARVIDLKKK